MSIFQSFIQGEQAAQNQALMKMKMAEMQRLGPLQEKLQMLEMERAQQTIQATKAKQEKTELDTQISESIVIGGLADQALAAPDEITRNSIINMASSNYGLDINPEEVTDSDLMALSAQGKAAKTKNDITPYQKRSLELQEQRIKLEGKRLEQGEDRLAVGINRLEASINAGLQENLARSKERGTQIGKGEGISITDAPKAYDTAVSTIDVIDLVFNHPGKDKALGIDGLIRPENYILGTPEYDFALKLNQLGGKAFMQAYQGLKGGGQITEIEGQKATDAIAQLSRKQSKEQFNESLNELRNIAVSGRSNALSKMEGRDQAKKANQVKRIRIDTSGNRL